MTAFLAAVGAVWALAQQIRDRPTAQQLEEVLIKRERYHEATGHKPLREEVQQVQKEQGEQRILIEGVEKEQRKHGKKLDKILDRVPVPKKRRPR